LNPINHRPVSKLKIKKHLCVNLPGRFVLRSFCEAGIVDGKRSADKIIGAAGKRDSDDFDGDWLSGS
jgi:hypothetical protein